MISYPNGEPIQVGDLVIMNRGREPGKVVEIIDTPEKLEHCGRDEMGVLVDLTTLGLNFWPVHALAFEDEIRFVSRQVVRV